MREELRERDEAPRPVSPEAAPPRATTPEPVPCKTPDCTLIFAHDGACIPAGSYSTYSAPTRESGALLDDYRDAISDEATAWKRYQNSELSRDEWIKFFDADLAAREALDARLSTLERDAARYRYLRGNPLVLDEINGAAIGTDTFDSLTDDAMAAREFPDTRAALSPSGDTG